MNKKLSALLEDGKVFIANDFYKAFTTELNKQEIEYFAFPMGNEYMIELDIPEE